MTTDEAREVLNKMYEAMWILISFKDQIESIDTTFVNNRRLVEALEVAIAALEQPVYHYLPEVPEDGEEVIGYIDGFDRGMIMSYRSDWFNSFIWNTPYAWTRIPPKPPVKEGGINGK